MCRVSGTPFIKVSSWEGDSKTLRTVARDTTGKKADFVSLRRINVDDCLIQTNSHGAVSMERVFVRK